jgi:hypothetical protein
MQEWHIDLLRTCFSSPANNTTEQEAEIESEYRSHIVSELEKQTMVVRGHDRDSRAILFKGCRTESETDEKAYTLAQIYLAERTIASTELLSKGKEEKLVLVFDFQGYVSAHSPPFGVLRDTVKLVQLLYPDRVKHIFILDPPFWMRGVYTILYPFIAIETREKISLVSGNEQKERLLSEYIDPQQAMPLMLSDGQLTSEIDIDHFLKRVPFHLLYDDVPLTTSK